jgi:putative sigma-54 modulation protein
MTLSPEIKSLCEEKASKLVRYYDRVTSIEVVLDHRQTTHTAEMIVHLDGNPPLVGTEEHDEAHAAVDLLMDKMERQLTRLKEKQRNRKHPPKTSGSGDTDA